LSTPPKPVPLSVRLRRRAEAALLIGLLNLARQFSIDRSSAVGGWIGRHVAAPLMRKDSTIETIGMAFPDLNRAGVISLIDGMGESLGRALAESASLEKFMGPEGRSRFTFEGLEHVAATKASGKPVLFVSGHFGNFELSFVAIHHVGWNASVVSRRPNNPQIADWYANKRTSLGYEAQIPKGPEGTRQMVSVLKKGGNVGMLIDQRLTEGIPVPLFGHEAMTAHTPAALAISLGAIIQPLAVRRNDGARFTAVFHPPILPPGLGNEARDIFAVTEAINAFVETEVRARPTDWLWMHKRWSPAKQLSRRAERLLAERDL
jgi:Kdo2-lipid IVA lauroyltransferase/acyltransferase